MTEQARVLVVDNDPDIGTLLEAFLAEQGFAVEAVGTAEEMRAQLAARTFDLVILDVVLAGPESGIDLARELGPRGIPVLLMTGHPRMMGAGGEEIDIVRKPFHLDDLLRRVRGALTSRLPDPSG